MGTRFIPIKTEKIKQIMQVLFKFNYDTELRFYIVINYTNQEGKLISSFNLCEKEDGTCELHINPIYKFSIYRKGNDYSRFIMDTYEYPGFIKSLSNYNEILLDKEKRKEIFIRNEQGIIIVNSSYASKREVFVKQNQKLEFEYSTVLTQDNTSKIGINMYINNAAAPTFISAGILNAFLFYFDKFNYIQAGYNALNLISSEIQLGIDETKTKVFGKGSYTQKSIFK